MTEETYEQQQRRLEQDALRKNAEAVALATADMAERRAADERISNIPRLSTNDFERLKRDEFRKTAARQAEKAKASNE